LLGGHGLAIAKARELTEIEQKLVAKIVELVLSTLVRAWRHLAEFSWKLVAQENDPQIVQIVTGSEIVLALRFELTVGEITGPMSLCLPVVVIEPLLEKVGAEYTFYGSRPKHKGVQGAITVEEIILRAIARIEAYMAGSSISVRDLLRLQVGDIVRLDNSVDDESCITISVCGKPKFAAKQGRVGNRQAIQIVARLR
jgi:flagellar motor switch protein FliM